MSSPSPGSRRARRWLLPAQALVLAGAAVMAVAAYATLGSTIAAQADSGAQINVGGRQRMLSQRIALLSMQVAAIPPGGSGRQMRLEELAEAIARMQREHAALLEGDPAMRLPGRPSPALARLYFAPPSHLHRDVLDYLSEAVAFHGDPPAMQSPANPHLLHLLAAVNGGLLARLDAVVGVHQRESELLVAGLHARLRGLLMVGLLLLACAAGLLLPLSCASTRESYAVEREHRLAARVMASVGHAMLVTDHENRIVEVNPAFSVITGYGRDEVIGRNPKLLSSGRHDARFYQEFWSRIDRTGSWEGIIWNRRKSGEQYAEWLAVSTVYDDRGNVEGRIAVFSDATERIRREEALRDGAETDSLTHLPNRARFTARLAELLADADSRGTKVGLFFIDLDGLKGINDRHGHAAGDGLLLEVAVRLRRALAPSEFAARLGGDEFVVIQSDIESMEAARGLATQLSQALSGPVVVAGHTAELSCSIGVTLYPDGGRDQRSLLRAADLSMLEVKRSGGNAYRITDVSGIARAEKTDRLTRELAAALRSGQLELRFQPTLALGTDRLVGAEALVRWNHPRHGLLPAAEFLGIAEQSGLIEEIGEWVLASACRAALEWNPPGSPLLPVSVNLSSRELVGSHLVQTVRTLLETKGLAPAALKLEFRADALLERGARGRPLLDELRGLGVGLLIDGYDTGRLSLQDAASLPLTGFKLDRVLTARVGSEPRANALASAVVALARGLELELVAGGIETAAQAAALRALGCTRGQGFFLGAPMTAQEFRNLSLASGQDGLGSAGCGRATPALEPRPPRPGCTAGRRSAALE